MVGELPSKSSFNDARGGHDAGNAVLVPGLDGGDGLLAGAQALEPVEEVVGAVDGFDGSYLPLAIRRFEGAFAGDRRGTVVDVHDAAGAVNHGAAAGGIPEVREVGEHETLGIGEGDLDLVAAIELVFIGPDEGVADRDGALRVGGAGEEIDEVCVVTHELADRTRAVIPVAEPSGEVEVAEGAFGEVHEKLRPVDFLGFDGHAVEPFVPIGFVAVGENLDARDLAEGAGAVELAASAEGGIAAPLRADLADDAALLDGVDGRAELGRIHGNGFFTVAVFPDPGRVFEHAGVLEVGGRDHDGVDVVEGEDFFVSGERARFAAVILFHLCNGAFAVGFPDVADGGDLDVLFAGVLADAWQVGAVAAIPAADLGDRDAFIGADDASVTFRGHGGRGGAGRGGGGGLEKFAAG